MNTTVSVFLISLLIVSSVPSFAEGLTLSGTVSDAKTHLPIGRATVSLVGGQAVHDETTDAKGNFILHLVNTVQRGDIVRLRVQKSEYEKYDEKVAVATELPRPIPLVPSKLGARAQSTPGKAPRSPVPGQQSGTDIPAKQQPSGSQNCPNGICISGDNNGTATVINNGPQPLPPPSVMICVSQVTAKDNVTENTTITLKTDRQIPRPFFAFLFDGPVLDGTAELADGHGAFGYLRARAEKLPNPENSFVFRLNSINFATSTWFPGDGAIKITVPSKGPVHLIRTLAGAGDDPDATFQVNLAYGCG